MTTQPDHAPGAASSAGAPGAAAQLLAKLRASSRAGTWVAAFEQDWAKALEDSRHSYNLAPLHDVVRDWEARLAAVPAVDAFFDDGCDDSDGMSLDDALGTRS